MRLTAVVHEAEEGGFWAEVPALPGCVAQGATIQELESHLDEAVHGWLLAAEPTKATVGAKIFDLIIAK